MLQEMTSTFTDKENNQIKKIKVRSENWMLMKVETLGDTISLNISPNLVEIKYDSNNEFLTIPCSMDMDWKILIETGFITLAMLITSFPTYLKECARNIDQIWIL